MVIVEIVMLIETIRDGGATHIGTRNLTLPQYGNASGLFIVAGGGGGNSTWKGGGHGGGTSRRRSRIWTRI